jgi:ribonucleoside-triphosphate reductase
VRAATIIGTLQATYTDFKYLSNTAKQLTDDEALLGVSITGMMENPNILLDPRIQEIAAKVAVDTNRIWAAILGIKQAARVCVLKPEGTSTLAVGSMASGIHPAHAYFMFRRVQANKLDNVYQFFKSYMPELTESSVWSANGTDDVITFPVVVPASSLTKGDLTALKHLDIIRSTQKHWIKPGTTEANTKPIEHNVSCTVSVREDEWGEVIEYLYLFKENFAAVSLLAASGDKDYAQAPNEAVSTEEDVQKFIKLMNNIVPLDYTFMVESEDGTSLMQEASCAGPEGCEVK